VTVHIREARTADAAAAADVMRRSIAELCEQDHGNDPAHLASWLANKTPDNVRAWIAGSHLYVAVEGERLLGVAGMTGSGYVTLIYVAPEGRFRGVSKALLRALEEKATELGCVACTLESSKTAERFYRAQGYSDQPGDSAKIMLGKRLTQGDPA